MTKRSHFGRTILAAAPLALLCIAGTCSRAAAAPDGARRHEDAEKSFEALLREPRSPARRLSKVERSLVGIWHFGASVPAGWGTTYAFFPNGRVAFRPGQEQCPELRFKARVGDWSVEGGTLRIRFFVELRKVGGRLEQFEEDPIGCSRRFVGAVAKLVPIERPELRLGLSRLIPREDLGGYLTPPSRRFGGNRLYKMREDPNDY